MFSVYLTYLGEFVTWFYKNQARVLCRHAQKKNDPLAQHLNHNLTLLTTRHYSGHQILPISDVKPFLISGLNQTPFSGTCYQTIWIAVILLINFIFLSKTNDILGKDSYLKNPRCGVRRLLAKVAIDANYRQTWIKKNENERQPLLHNQSFMSVE